MRCEFGGGGALRRGEGGPTWEGARRRQGDARREREGPVRVGAGRQGGRLRDWQRGGCIPVPMIRSTCACTPHHLCLHMHVIPYTWTLNDSRAS